MIDGIWPLVLIVLVAFGALGMASVLLFSRSDLKSSKATLWIAIFGALLASSPTIYQSFKKPEAYVFVKCQATSETAPSTVLCVAETSEYDLVKWSVDNEVVKNVSGLTIEKELHKPGEYSFEATVINKNFFRKAESSFSTQVVISEPPPLEPQTLEIKQSFSQYSKTSRTFRLFFPPKNGFEIVSAKLENVRTSKAYNVEVSIDNGVAIVTGQLKPKQYFKGFSMHSDPAKVSGLVALTQQQVE